MFSEALNGGAGRTREISQGNDRAGSSIEFGISNENNTSRLRSEGVMQANNQERMVGTQIIQVGHLMRVLT